MKNFPIEIGWDNWGEIMCDAQLFAPLVRQACAAFGYAPEKIEAGFPGTHAVFCVDDIYVVKLYAPLGLEDEAAERACYRAIEAARIPLTPKLFAEGALHAGGYEWPYIVIEYLPGTAVREVWKGLSQDRRMEIGAALGEWARGYHALANPFGENQPVAKWDAMAQWARTKEGLLKDNRLNGALVQALEAFALEGIGKRARDVMLVHCDLTEDHLLIDGEKMKLIDFADSRMAWECLEWTPLWFGMLARDDGAFFAFLGACGHVWSRELRDELLLGVLLHNFAVPILADSLFGIYGDDAGGIESVEALYGILPRV